MEGNVLPFFWRLASSSKETRLSASADLVGSLETFQQTFLESKGPEANGVDADDDEDAESSDDEEDEDSDESGIEADGDGSDGGDASKEAVKLDRQLAARNAQDVVYSVKRLIRGLGSSRESSRLGFAVALTELLSRIESITAPQVYSLIVRSSPHSNSMKGPEERDALFARLFGLTCLIHSGTLFRPSSNFEIVKEVVGELLQLGEVKGWLRESAWWGIIGIIEGLQSSELEWRDEALATIADQVLDGSTWHQEKVAIALRLEKLRPDLDWKKLLLPVFRHTPLLSSHNLVSLGRILKEGGPSDDDEEGVQSASTGSWKPQLHFIWNIIFDTYFPSETSTLPPRSASFQDFYRVVVDESLFSNTSSPERKYWGFLVLSRALPLVPSSQLPLLFTPNVMRSWMNNLSSSDRYLHKASLNLAKQVQETVKSNPAVAYTLLSVLIGKGRTDFDKVTKTKTVESIMGSLSAEGVKEYVDYLKNAFIGTESKNSGNNSSEDRRAWALDQFASLFRNGSVPKSADWVEEVLDLLTVHAFFTITKPIKKTDISALRIAPSPPLSDATVQQCRTKLFTCLVEITTASASSSETNDISSKLWLRHVLDLITKSEKQSSVVEMIGGADEEIEGARDAAKKTLQALSSVKKGNPNVIKGAEILLTFCVLRTYDENEDALDMLEDINTAIRRIFKLPSSEASSSKVEQDNDDVAPIDELLDVLVALLDKGSSDLRSLANMVFGMVSSAFTSSSIQHLVAQLEQTVASNAENQIEDDSMDEDDDEEDVDDSASSAGSGSSGAESLEGASDDEENSDEDIEVEDEDDPNAVVDPEFRKRVAEALQVAGMLDEGSIEGSDDGSESGSEDGDSSEEEYWDDDQMLKVDEQLAEVFRQRATRSKKADMKNLQVESVHFKLRILDFFDVFMRKQAANPLVLETIMPLLQLVRNSSASETDLLNKASSILRTRLGKAKELPASASGAIKILEEIHELARKAPSAEYSALLSVCSIYVVRTLDGKTNQKATKIYGETLEDFMVRKSSSVHTTFIIDFIRRFPSTAFPLTKNLLSNILFDDAGKVKVYRQVQGCNMLQIFSQQLSVITKSVSKESILDFVKNFKDTTYSLLKDVAKAEGGDGEGSATSQWNAARLRDVAKTTLHLCRTSKAILTIDEFTSTWAVDESQQLVDVLKNGERTKAMKGLHGLFEQMIGVARASSSGKEAKKSKKGIQNGEGKPKEVGNVKDAEMSIDGAAVANGAASEGESKKKEKRAERSEKGKKRKSVGEGETAKEKKKRSRPSQEDQ